MGDVGAAAAASAARVSNISSRPFIPCVDSLFSNSATDWFCWFCLASYYTTPLSSWSTHCVHDSRSSTGQVVSIVDYITCCGWSDCNWRAFCAVYCSRTQYRCGVCCSNFGCRTHKCQGLIIPWCVFVPLLMLSFVGRATSAT